MGWVYPTKCAPGTQDEYPAINPFANDPGAPPPPPDPMPASAWTPAPPVL